MRISSRFTSIKTKLILIWIFGFAFVLPLNFNSMNVNAQPTPSLPTSTLPTPSSSGNGTIEITSPEDGQEVPAGELTIEGVSSDDAESNCQVYADANDITPMQNVTAAGTNGRDDDFSHWSYTYTNDYQLIKEGANELTAKISCFDGNSSTPMSEWHSINVTGVTGPPTTMDEGTTDEPIEDEGTTSAEEETTDTDEETTDTDEDIMPGVPPVG
jgi:hypothetical protein